MDSCESWVCADCPPSLDGRMEEANSGCKDCAKFLCFKCLSDHSLNGHKRMTISDLECHAKAHNGEDGKSSTSGCSLPADLGEWIRSSLGPDTGINSEEASDWPSVSSDTNLSTPANPVGNFDSQIALDRLLSVPIMAVQACIWKWVLNIEYSVMLAQPTLLAFLFWITPQRHNIRLVFGILTFSIAVFIEDMRQDSARHLGIVIVNSITTLVLSFQRPELAYILLRDKNFRQSPDVLFSEVPEHQFLLAHVSVSLFIFMLHLYLGFSGWLLLGLSIGGLFLLMYVSHWQHAMAASVFITLHIPLGEETLSLAVFLYYITVIRILYGLTQDKKLPNFLSQHEFRYVGVCSVLFHACKHGGESSGFLSVLLAAAVTFFSVYCLAQLSSFLVFLQFRIFPYPPSETVCVIRMHSSMHTMIFVWIFFPSILCWYNILSRAWLGLWADPTMQVPGLLFSNTPLDSCYPHLNHLVPVQAICTCLQLNIWLMLTDNAVCTASNVVKLAS